MKARLQVRCVGCRNKRWITATEAAKGQPFCPECGNVEVVVKAEVKSK